MKCFQRGLCVSNGIMGVYFDRQVLEKITVVVSLCLCLKHEELNDENIKQNLVQVRTTYDSISWLQVW